MPWGQTAALLVGLQWRSHAANRFNFVISQISGLIFYVCSACAIVLIVVRFGSIGGFDTAQVLLNYGLALVSYFLAGIFTRNFARTLEELVRTREFDLILLLPFPTLALLMLRSVEPAMLVKALVALGLVLYVLDQVEGLLSWQSATWLIPTILGGVLIQGGAILTLSCLIFWIGGGKSLVELLVYSIRRFVDFPISIYPVLLQKMLIFAIPYAFVNFIPISELEHSQKPTVMYLLPVAVGAIVAALSGMVWHLGLRGYRQGM